MKKIGLLVITFFMTLSLSGCIGKSTSYQELNYDKLMKMFEDKKEFTLFIGSNQCSYCQSYKPKLQAVVKANNLKVYYIDVNNLSEEENQKLESYVPYSGTPFTAFIKDGKLKENGADKQVYSIAGDRDIDYIKKVFQKNGYIKE